MVLVHNRYCNYGVGRMNIENATMPKQPNILILFVGDYVQLHNNFYGHNPEWLRITEIEPYDICLLSNGARVCAS